MGKVLSSLKHPFRNFNLEYRAHKAISKEKPVIAPKHDKEKLSYEQMLKEYPEVYQKSLEKHEVLDKRLKEVYVTSNETKINQTNTPETPDRPLPANRHLVEDFEFGYAEPVKVPLGKATLKTILQFITNHQAKPKEFTAAKIAEDCLLPEATVKNILKYNRVFEMYVPQQRNVKAHFAGPAVTRQKIKQVKLKELPLLKKGKEDP